MSALEIPRQGTERVEWWTDFFNAVANDAYRTGEKIMDEQNGSKEAAVGFMEDYGDWLKNGVDIALEEALVLWNALR